MVPNLFGLHLADENMKERHWKACKYLAGGPSWLNVNCADSIRTMRESADWKNHETAA